MWKTPVHLVLTCVPIYEIPVYRYEKYRYPYIEARALGVQRVIFWNAEPEDPRVSSPDAAFSAFSKFWEELGQSLAQVLVYVPEHADFLRLRGFFRNRNTPFCSMTEFTSNKNLSRRRLEFQKGAHTVALITERFVWYRRYRIKGARHVVFYGPPSERAVFIAVYIMYILRGRW